MDAWRGMSATLGRRVRVESPDGVVEGLAAGIDSDWALLVETDKGRPPVRVLFGDCLHLGHE
jgi:BirA family biotin operon repressor/biotin-[acetyl-CoA-carboxylase] ligase